MMCLVVIYRGFGECYKLVPEAERLAVVTEHLLNSGEEQGGFIPRFDPFQAVRGYHIIECKDQFSTDFFGSCKI